MNGSDEARRLIAQERERQTGFLDIGNLGLTELPPELFELTRLRSLVIGRLRFQPGTGWLDSANHRPSNAVQSLPLAIANLQSLDSVWLAGNPVSDLGPLEGLSNLQSLDCGSTRVSDFGLLRGLSSLQFLACWGAQVSDLKVIPLILADAELGSLAERLQRAIHWTNQEAELQPLIQGNLLAVGTAFYAKFKLIGEFARNTSNMLEHLVDKLMPRDFDRMAAEGFREVRELIGAKPRRPGA